MHDATLLFFKKNKYCTLPLHSHTHTHRDMQCDCVPTIMNVNIILDIIIYYTSLKVPLLHVNSYRQYLNCVQNGGETKVILLTVNIVI